MKRMHLFEFHELKYFPNVWRNLLTDFLSFFAYSFKPYKGVAKKLADAFAKTGDSNILDLCSGAAKPILTVKQELEKAKSSIRITLSDKFPNKEAFEELEGAHAGMVTPVYSSVDATDVPAELTGFRTIFTAFHHFKEQEALLIIADAIEKRQGIGLFEYTERSLAWGFYTLNIPWVVLVSSLFIKPFSWQRFVFTYLFPILPLLVCIDGAVSCLRTYSPTELENLVKKVEKEKDCYDYIWEIGQVRSMLIMRVTYLIGYPAK